MVEDFSQSQGDRLDLRGMVGHTSFPGSKLTFIGTAAFSGSAQTRSGAGSVRYSYRGDTTDTDTTNDTLYTDVTVDLDGNGKADFRVTLERAHYTLTDADLLLGYPTLWVAPPAVLAFGGEIEPAAVHMALSPCAGRAPAPPLYAALRRCRGGVIGVAGFSAVAIVLLLVAPMSMSQIYDRVLPSTSHATLIALTGVAVFLLSCFGLLDWIRQRLMTCVALTLHDGSVDAVMAGSYHASLRRARQSGGQPVRDLTTVRQFLNTPSTLAFFDAPWAPVFLGAVFLLHAWLGVLALLSTGVLLGLGVLTGTRSRGPYSLAAEQAAEAQRFAENGLRHADVLAAMAMTY